jgi:hypothetical protein
MTNKSHLVVDYTVISASQSEAFLDYIMLDYVVDNIYNNPLILCPIPCRVSHQYD